MAYSYVRYEASGSTANYTFSFPYLDTSHINVRLNGELTTAFTFLNASTIAFNTAPAENTTIEIRRVTPKDSAIVDFQDGSVLLEKDLDLLATFNLYVAQETDDLAQSGLFAGDDGTYDAEGLRIKNVGDPLDPQDAVSKVWAESAMTSQLAQASNLVSQAESLVSQADSIISSFTISTEAPSGGNDGDVWFKVTN